MDLNFVIKKQELIRTDEEIIASYTVNWTKCKFCCPHEWSKLYKYALFINAKGKESIVQLGIGKKVDCIIPEEILTGNFFYISVFANDRLTTTQQLVLIQPSGLNDNITDSLEDEIMNEEVDYAWIPSKPYGKMVHPNTDSVIDMGAYPHIGISPNSTQAMINVELDKKVNLDLIAQDPADDGFLHTYFFTQNGIQVGAKINVGSVAILEGLRGQIRELDNSISVVGKSGSYNDLMDLPSEFTPAPHTHSSEEITDLNDTVESEIKLTLRMLKNNILRERT